MVEKDAARNIRLNNAAANTAVGIRVLRKCSLHDLLIGFVIVKEKFPLAAKRCLVLTQNASLFR